MSEQTKANTGAPLGWAEIKKSVLDYQAYLKKHHAEPHLRRKAFLLDRATIEKLLATAGDKGAIRLYLGSEPDGTGLRVFPVACRETKDASGKIHFEDVNIPQVLPDPTTTSTVLPETCETRPCPPECTTNFLNA